MRKTTVAAKGPLQPVAKADRQFVTALARGLEVLRCFTPSRTELGTVDIARLTGLPQPTAWRLCHTLLELGYLAPSPSGDKLRIGTGVLGLGYAALAALDFGEVVQQGMQRLADEFGAAASLAVPERLEMLIVRRATAVGATLLVNLHVGSRLDMGNSSFGWAYLAAVDDATRTALLPQLAKAHGAQGAELRKRIEGACAMYRKHGYVVNSGSFHRDINAISVPIVPRGGGQILALNVGGPAAQVSVKRLESEAAPRLVELAGLLRDSMDQQRRRRA